jgi:hypothetical protein
MALRARRSVEQLSNDLRASAGPLSKSFYGTYDQGGALTTVCEVAKLAVPAAKRNIVVH